jgi:hypothetical protein
MKENRRRKYVNKLKIDREVAYINNAEYNTYRTISKIVNETKF